LPCLPTGRWQGFFGLKKEAPSVMTGAIPKKYNIHASGGFE